MNWGMKLEFDQIVYLQTKIVYSKTKIDKAVGEVDPLRIEPEIEV